MSETIQSAEATAMPPALNRWNWGAFLLNFVWGIKYNVDFAFLALVPVFGIIAAVFLGLKGNAWAWKNGNWTDEEAFVKSQANWTFAGFVTWFFIAVCLFIPLLNGVINFKWSRSAVYQQSTAEFVKIEKMQRLLGENVSTKLQSAKRLGKDRMRLGIRLAGDKSVFKARFYIMKIEKQWKVYRITLFEPGNRSSIDYPLPYDMLMYGSGVDPKTVGNAPKTYNVIVVSAGDAMIRHLAQVVADLDENITLDKAVDLVRFAPRRVYSGATEEGALKIQRKLEDFGAVADVKKGPAEQ